MAATLNNETQSHPLDYEKSLDNEEKVTTRPRRATLHARFSSQSNQLPELHNNLPISSPHRNTKWSLKKISKAAREPVAEFAGTAVLVLFGLGVQCQAGLTSNTAVSEQPKGDYLSICFGWAAGIALGAWISGSVSGGHINPAVTIALACFRSFPWRKVPLYLLAQLLGGFCGAAVVYGNYFHAIDLFEGGIGVRTVPGTASLFATYTLPYMTPVSAFFSEFLATAFLLIVLMAVTDKRNTHANGSSTTVPLALFLTMLGISSAFGSQTGFAINPARDFGPRLFTAIIYGRQVFDYRSQYWIWGPITAPICGAIMGVLVYDTLLFKYGEDEAN